MLQLCAEEWVGIEQEEGMGKAFCLWVDGRMGAGYQVGTEHTYSVWPLEQPEVGNETGFI